MSGTGNKQKQGPGVGSLERRISMATVYCNTRCNTHLGPHSDEECCICCVLSTWYLNEK